MSQEPEHLTVATETGGASTAHAPESRGAARSARSKGARAPLRWRALGALLRPFLRVRTEPPQPDELLEPASGPLIYILERPGLSNLLILEEACRASGLPPPLRRIEELSLAALPRAVIVLHPPIRRFSRARPSSYPPELRQLLRMVEDNSELDIRMLPVSIFVGRAPGRDGEWLRVLFSENWVMVGGFRRLLALLLNGRDTLVHFSRPVSLREVAAEGLPTERAARKSARVLRTHFRRIRSAIIGPDLSHRRTVIDAIVNAPPVREAIAGVAQRERQPLEKVQARARDLAWEIAADYSHPVVRALWILLKPLWNRLYDGVQLRHLDSLKQIAPGHEVIYVPCHRSHMDYLLLSYLLFDNHIVPPHIAAGINLNMPLVGPILRRGGAFFLRRSFRANALYASVFTEYVQQLIRRGTSIEYFIEGGRSRTGRLLPAKVGMLGMTVRGFLRDRSRPVVFQPVYIGYEKLLEGRSYIGELSGAKKKQESLFGALRGLRKLRDHYGRVAVSFGEPVFLQQHLDDSAPDWQIDADEERPPWFNKTVDSLGDRILVNINRSADVNPVNLLGAALLSTPRHAMAESDLLRQLALFKILLERVPYSDRVTVTELDPAAIIAYGERMGIVLRTRHPLGDVLSSAPDQSALLSYFRNNVLHLLTTAAWCAAPFLNNRQLRSSTIIRLGRFIYPFIQNELFLPWTAEEFGLQIDRTLDVYVDEKLLARVGEGGMLRRPVGQTDAAFHLRVIAQTVTQAFERYYIAVAVLVKNGRRSLTTAELENLGHLIAQRLSLLYANAAPEFFDKTLFRNFIALLKERRVIWLDDAGRLDFADELEGIARDARFVLSRELRHSILKLTDQERELVPVLAAEAESQPD